MKRSAYELAAECLQINYYGLKKTTEKLLPLLQLSDSPRIVNVSSTMGRLGVLAIHFNHTSTSNRFSQNIFMEANFFVSEYT